MPLTRRSIGIAGPVAALTFLLATAALYGWCWPTVTPDMTEFLLPWLTHLARQGPAHAFAAPFGNYAPPYLYLLAVAFLGTGALPGLTLVKLVSVLGSCALAAATALLLRSLKAPRPALFSTATLALPTLVWNGPFLGQCDAWWVAPCLMAIREAVRDRPNRMLGWAGLAVAVKAQAAFLAPFVILVLVRRRIAPHRWMIAPLAVAAAWAPAWLAGWPAADLLFIYLRQANLYAMPGNLANVWAPIGTVAPHAASTLFPLGYAAALGATLAYIIWLARRPLGPRALVFAALLSAFAMPALLPKMHERYYLLADLLAYVYACAGRDRAGVLIATGVQLCSLLSLFAFTVHLDAPVASGGPLSLVLLGLMVQTLIVRPPPRPDERIGIARAQAAAPGPS